MNTQQVVTAILNGECDEGFDAIYDAIRSRDRAKAQMLGAALRIGDKVRFKSNAKPKYLRGAEGTVCSPPGGARVGLKFKEPVGRFPANAEIRGHISTLEKVEA